jgi:hypothetical protein
MFDPWKQARLNTGLQNLNNRTLTEKEVSVDEIKRLAGVNASTEFKLPSANKAQIQRERNIKAGTDEWFKLWFGDAR